jgi:peroxiredoxin
MSTTSTRWKRWVQGLGIAALVVVASSGSAELRTTGSEAPDFTLRALDGGEVTLSDLRGKPVVLEFWASWCGPCRRQFPKMAELHHRYDQQVHFLLVNTAESEAAIRRFAEKVELPGTVLMDPEDRVGQLYGTRILPSTFVIDARGTIQAAVPGALQDVEAFLEGQLSDGG